MIRWRSTNTNTEEFNSQSEKDQIKRQRFVEQMKKKQKTDVATQMKQRPCKWSGGLNLPSNDNDTDEATNNNVKKKAKPTKTIEKQPTGSVNRTKTGSLLKAGFLYINL